MKGWKLFISLCVVGWMHPVPTVALADPGPITTITRERLHSLEAKDLRSRAYRLFRWDQFPNVLIAVFQIPADMQEALALMSIYAWANPGYKTYSSDDRKKLIKELLSGREDFEKYLTYAHDLSFRHIMNFQRDVLKFNVDKHPLYSTLEYSLLMALRRKSVLGFDKEGMIGIPAKNPHGALIAFTIKDPMDPPLWHHVIDRSLWRARFLVDPRFQQAVLKFFDPTKLNNHDSLHWIDDLFSGLTVDHYLHQNSQPERTMTFDPNHSLRLTNEGQSFLLASPPEHALPWSRGRVEAARRALLEHLSKEGCDRF